MKIGKIKSDIYFCTLSCGERYVAFPSFTFDDGSDIPIIDDTCSIYYVCRECGDFIFETVRDKREVINYFKDLERDFC